MKKSFLLYLDSLDVIEELSDEQVGKLLRKMKSYHNGNDYISNDKLVDVLFINFKNQFDRDLETYNNVCDRNREIAVNRWNKKKVPKSTKSTTRIITIPESTRNTDNDNDNDNDKHNDNKKDKENIYFDNIDVNKTFLDYLDMRIQIKKKATQTAINNKIKFLNNYRDDIKIKILNKSIDNNWTDLYELKPEQQPYNKNKPPGLIEGNKTKVWKPQEYNSKIPLSLKDIE